MPVTKNQALHALIGNHFSDRLPKRLGVAVSGGSDSLALLALLYDLGPDQGFEIYAVTVDHGLRPESATEAAQVAQICAGLNVPHQILKWSGWDGQGNLPDQARRARYCLMAGWAKDLAIDHIAIGHTANDIAETFLMRLGREAGVDGLSAMAPAWLQDGITFHRPLLRATREELRGYLRAQGLKWVDDPSNEDTAYARVRARNALVALEPLGLSVEGLAAVAYNMSAVRQTLYSYVLQVARQLVTLQAGDLLMDHAGLLAQPPEISRRLLQAALKWISGAEYGPRGRAMGALMQAIKERRDMTLSGCLIMVSGDRLRVTREYNAVAEVRCDVQGLWDGRWQINGPKGAKATIAALGARGLTLCPDRRVSGLPDASLMATPALWRGSELLSAPLAGLENGVQAVLSQDLDHFFSTLLFAADVSVSH